MEIRLDGEVAVVTGAARGIGLGVARAMAEAGAVVAMLDRAAELEVAASEVATIGTVSCHHVDVSDAAAVSAAVQGATEALGDPTVLVTAAAIDHSVDLLDLESEEWRELIAINLDGTFHSLKAVLPAMLRRGGGRVVMFGSNIGLKGGHQIAHYGAAKAGVHGLARCAAIDLAPHNIAVNVVAPGPVETDMLASLPADWREAKKRELLTGAFGTVEQIVPTVLLLASEAGAFYTGATINVSGGDVLQ